jgi:hypothetical protein
MRGITSITFAHDAETVRRQGGAWGKRGTGATGPVSLFLPSLTQGSQAASNCARPASIFALPQKSGGLGDPYCAHRASTLSS